MKHSYKGYTIEVVKSRLIDGYYTYGTVSQTITREADNKVVHMATFYRERCALPFYRDAKRLVDTMIAQESFFKDDKKFFDAVDEMDVVLEDANKQED